MKGLLHIVTALCLVMLFSVTAFASDADTEMFADRLFDGADLLSDADESELLKRLDAVSEEYGFDIVIATVDSIGFSSAEAYADDFYDYGGYRADGALLLIGMEERDIAISTCGSGMNIVSNSRIDGFWSRLTDYFSDGSYAAGFDFFIDKCEYYLDGEVNGFPFNFVKAFLISAVICIIVAVVITSYHKGQLKSVVRNNLAGSYVRDGSMSMKASNDIYLYRNVTRTRRQTSNSGGSHTSSSGRSHGGRSGKF